MADPQTIQSEVKDWSADVIAAAIARKAVSGALAKKDEEIRRLRGALERINQVSIAQWSTGGLYKALRDAGEIARRELNRD